MKTKAFVCIFFSLILFQACTKKSAAEFTSDFSLFKEYINSVTSGIVPARSDIRVVLAFEKKEWKVNQVLENNLFDISPSVDGKVVALAPNTIAFIPEKKLDQNTEYQVTFHLSKVIKVPEKLNDFHYTFKTIKQDFIISTNDIQSYSKDFQYLNCTLKSADELDFESAKKIVSAQQKGKDLKVKFEKSAAAATEFRFVIDSIQRYVEDSTLEIAYDGEDVSINQKGLIKFPIAGKDNFKVVDVEVPDNSNQSLLINFSDPLQKGQNFDGLVAVEDTQNLKYATQGNVLKVFFDKPLKGNLLLEVFQGIESEEGYKMKKSFATKVSFEQIKPNVRLIRNGTIMPSSNNLRLNFEAVNLKAVDVKIYKIYKNNVLQFLQQNELNGHRGLKYVSQPIAKRVVNLKSNTLLKLDKWNTFALDLSKIITPEPGAIYRVQFEFKKKYSLYQCETSEPDENNEEEEEDEKDVNYSDYYEDYYYDDYQ